MSRGGDGLALPYHASTEERPSWPFLWLWQLFEFKPGGSQGTRWAASWSRRPLKGWSFTLASACAESGKLPRGLPGDTHLLPRRASNGNRIYKGCEERATLGNSPRASTLKELNRWAIVESPPRMKLRWSWVCFSQSQGRCSCVAPTLGCRMERRWRSDRLQVY